MCIPIIYCISISKKVFFFLTFLIIKKNKSLLISSPRRFPTQFSKLKNGNLLDAQG